MLKRKSRSFSKIRTLFRDPASGVLNGGGVVYWIPNLLSGMRLICAPFVGLLIVFGHEKWALLGVIVAFLTDFLDGWMARFFHWETPLGQLLDPLADKVLTFSIFTALVLCHKLPWSLYAVVLLRDVCIGLGVWSVHYRKGAVSFEPILISKWNTAIQGILCAAILWGKNPVVIACGIFFLWITTVFSFAMYGVQLWKTWE